MVVLLLHSCHSCGFAVWGCCGVVLLLLCCCCTRVVVSITINGNARTTLHYHDTMTRAEQHNDNTTTIQQQHYISTTTLHQHHNSTTTALRQHYITTTHNTPPRTSTTTNTPQQLLQSNCVLLHCSCCCFGFGFRCFVLLQIDRPTPRWLHCAAVVRDKLWIYGGQGHYYCREVWCLDFGSLPEDPHLILNPCLRAPPPIALTRTEIEGLVPPPRVGLSAVISQSPDTVLLFGGKVLGQGTTNGLLQMRVIQGGDDLPASVRFEQVKVQGPLPQKRWCHSCAKVRHRMVVFGGWDREDDSQFLNDVWIYDLEASAWTPVETSGHIPRPRCQAPCFVLTSEQSTTERVLQIVSHYLVVFGGACHYSEPGSAYGDLVMDLYDFCIVDLQTGVWLPTHGCWSKVLRGGVNACVTLAAQFAGTADMLNHDRSQPLTVLLHGGMHSEPGEHMPVFKEDLHYVVLPF